MILHTNKLVEAYERFCQLYDELEAESKRDKKVINLYKSSLNAAKFAKSNCFPKGVIYGYNTEENKCEAGKGEGCHFFLVIDNQFIIDFWYLHKTQQTYMVFDMFVNPGYSRMMYGYMDKWAALRQTAEINIDVDFSSIAR